MDFEMDFEAEEAKAVALGADVVEEVEEIYSEIPPSPEERLAQLEQRVFHLTASLDSISVIVKHLWDKVEEKDDSLREKILEKTKSSEKIPEGTVLTGTTKGVPYFCVARDGAFWVGIHRYETLSAAAEGVSGVRRSGWTFWRLKDGRTVKDVYKG